MDSLWEFIETIEILFFLIINGKILLESSDYMSNKAFTLIELLAVIVILAIIALIAVPIVVNIIDDSKKSSNEESIKMYGKAIENAAGNYFLKHPEKKNVTVQNLKDENLINYDGRK